MKFALFNFLFIFSLLKPGYSATICYFSLNNQKEYQEMQKMASRLNEVSTEKINLIEFVQQGDGPERSFLKMVESGTKCDGLVISGHHTGSYGGQRVEGTLSVDYMEKLSCDPRYKDFFNQIKALWLQGCRTLGVSKISVNDTADHHSERVYGVRDDDGLSQGLLDMNREFSATLDQDNPLSSRYLRIFPRATAFGWTKTAPGEDARSELSIPFHIAQMAKTVDDRHRFFDNPSSQFDEQSAVKYADAILSILKVDYGDNDCRQVELDAIDAWIDHGSSPKTKRYAFNNPDLNAYHSLALMDGGELWEAKSVECILKNSTDPSVLLQTIKRALSDPFLIGHTFNSIYEVLMRLKREGQFELHQQLISLLNSNDAFTQFLMKKLDAKDLGVVRKIDYYVFYRELAGEDNARILADINHSFVSLLERNPTASGNVDYELRDAQITLIQSMFKHHLLRSEELSAVLKKDLDSTVSLSIIAGLQQFPIENADKCLHELILSRHPIVQVSAAKALGALPMAKEKKQTIILQMVEGQKEQSLGPLAGYLSTASCEDRGCQEMILTTLSKYPQSKDVSAVLYQIGRVKLNNADEFFRKAKEIFRDTRFESDVEKALYQSPSASVEQKFSWLRDNALKNKSCKGLSVNSLIFTDSQADLFRSLMDLCSADSLFLMADLLSRSDFSPSMYSQFFHQVLSASSGLVSRGKILEKLSGELLVTSKIDAKERKALWDRILIEHGMGDLEFFNLTSKILSFNQLTQEDFELLRRFSGSIKNDFFKRSVVDLIQKNKKLSADQKAKLIP